MARFPKGENPKPKKKGKSATPKYNSTRRSVIMCCDAPKRHKGIRTGAQRVFGFTYDDLCQIFDMKTLTLRREVRLGRLMPDSLRAVVAYANTRRLARNTHLKALRKGRRSEFLEGFSVALKLLGIPH